MSGVLWGTAVNFVTNREKQWLGEVLRVKVAQLVSSKVMIGTLWFGNPHSFCHMSLLLHPETWAPS